MPAVIEVLPKMHHLVSLRTDCMYVHEIKARFGTAPFRITVNNALLPVIGPVRVEKLVAPLQHDPNSLMSHDV